MKSKFRLLYGVLMILVLSTMTMGATYAYWAATARSAENTIMAGSTGYSISMGISPLYHGFSVIPMNDSDALKGLKNQCKDKYDRGACSAYVISVYDYSDTINYISGFMDITTNNMQNISYMVLRISDTFEEDSCVTIESTADDNGELVSENYCIVREASPMEDGVGLSLGDQYDVTGTDSTKFILLMWLSNLDFSQNQVDIGTFSAIVTMQLGSGGQIKGSIEGAIKVENPGGSNVDTEDNKENTGDVEDNNQDVVGDGE